MFFSKESTRLFWPCWEAGAEGPSTWAAGMEGCALFSLISPRCSLPASRGPRSGHLFTTAQVLQVISEVGGAVASVVSATVRSVVVEVRKKSKAKHGSSVCGCRRCSHSLGGGLDVTDCHEKGETNLMTVKTGHVVYRIQLYSAIWTPACPDSFDFKELITDFRLQRAVMEEIHNSTRRYILQHISLQNHSLYNPMQYNTESTNTLWHLAKWRFRVPAHSCISMNDFKASLTPLTQTDSLSLSLKL